MTHNPAAGGPRPRHVTCFRLADASVTLTTTVTAAVRAAQDTLYAYRTTTDPHAAWHVTITVADPRHSLLDAPPDVGDIREIGPSELTARHITEDEREVFWIDRHRTLVVHDPTRRATTVHCATDDAATYYAARLVRQLITAQLLAAGAVYTHTAALVHRDHGILIAGHPGAGKTTTLVAVLRQLGGEFVTSDRLLLTPDRNGGLLGYAWPAHIRVGVGTLLAYPDLTGLVPIGRRTDPADLHTKLSIEPPDISRLLHAGTLTASCRPHVMIWPQLSPIAGNARHQRIPAGTVHATLTDNQLFMHRPTSGASSHINHWLAPTPPAHTTESNRRAVIAALARTVPCYALVGRPDPTTVADAVTAILHDTETATR
ncbi:hypothetical protein Franean1_2830 [Parafrankia sp. EAN1pec]|uniref:hypothetical protein n=1 Tax=Parafrankia sp. (strain EAN1pec) TaxID=298653 RepID=UPI00005436D2|nr:hypothetical protein Franean1_2830 [Frankia sp. EAN1pec]